MIIKNESGTRWLPVLIGDFDKWQASLPEESARRMDPFHARLARVALAAAEPYGFALAGGYAAQAQGFLDRPSADVDIFITSRAEGDFPAAVDAVIDSLQGDGLIPEAEIRNRSFARIAVAAGAATADLRLLEPVWHVRRCR